MGECVEYMCHCLDATGLHPTPQKLAAIQEVSPPTNVQELHSFLSLLNCYAKFIPNLSTLIHPLNRLLHQQRTRRWTKACQTAFQSVKDALSSNKVLAHKASGKASYRCFTLQRACHYLPLIPRWFRMVYCFRIPNSYC